MNKPSSQAYAALRAYLDKVPVIDAHEHYFAATETGPMEAMALMVNPFYTCDDLRSVAPGAETALQSVPMNRETQFTSFYDVFEPIYKKCRHTAYLKGAARGVFECWGVDEISRESLMALQPRLDTRDNAFYESMMEKHRIKAKIVDLCDPERMLELIEKGKIEGFSDYCRFAFPLASFHNFYDDGTALPQLLSRFLNEPVRDFETYLRGFETLVKKALETGKLCCLKDAQAYRRLIKYDEANKKEAEAIFTRLIETGRIGQAESILLSNRFLRAVMRVAEKYNLPVQIHTGHLAGLRGDIARANAVHLTSLINDFPGVHFDLFHGNWPYMGEYLFLGKNYPNVSLDLCWAQAIDCEYAIELMRRAVMTMPHTKVVAYGGDCARIESTIGFLCQARDNVAFALSDLVENEWLSSDDAKEIACDWFFNNPNRIFNLGFAPCDWKEV